MEAQIKIQTMNSGRLHHPGKPLTGTKRFPGPQTGWRLRFRFRLRL